MMKNTTRLKPEIFLLILPLALFLMSFQPQEINEITGKWAFPDSPREIELYKQNDKYYAKIIKISGEDKKEKVGHIMLTDLVYDQSEKLYSGKANSPSGMTASSEIVLLDENRLQINVSKFFVINKSYILTRIK
ncbi:MAG: DUF2147 domain-containing protein [Bacteroidales bacterium]|jgi:hypothetical protein|nr:DUF2147 domain-containing protein [Bacteroidales bacterium]